MRALAWESVSPCLPLRGRWQRVALTEGAISHGISSPPVARADSPPPSGGLAARRCRADGTSYPKGICSAALHGRTPSPTGGSTHLPRRAARPQAAVYPQAFSSTVQRSKASLPLCSAPTCPFVGNRHRPTPLTCHGMVPQASRTHFSGIAKPRDFRRGVSCWRYLSSQAVSSQVLSAEANLTDLSRDGAAGIPNCIFSGITKPRDFRRGVSCWRYLSSQAVSSQVLSAEASLTSVFGMGTGGPSP